MKTKLKRDTKDKKISNKFKDFFEKRAKIFKERKALNDFLSKRSEYKKEFFKIENDREKYFRYGYLYCLFDNISNYLNTDIVLVVQKELNSFKELLEMEMNKIEGDVAISEITKDIINFHSKSFHNQIMKDAYLLNFKNLGDFKTESLYFYEDTLTSISNKKFKVVYALQEIVSDKEGKMLCYPKSDFDFCFTLNYLLKHIEAFNRANDHLANDQLNKIKVSLEEIHEKIYLYDLLPHAIDYSEGKSMILRLSA